MFQKISIHPLNLEKAKDSFKKIAPTEQEYKSVMSWLKDLAVENQITDRRQLRLLHDLGLYFRNYPNPTNKITRDDLVGIKEDLLNDKILKQNGEPYSDTIKEGLTESLVRYLETTYPKRMNSFISKSNKPLRRWFIMRSKKKTPEILTDQEIKTLYKESKSLWQKYAIAVLFGSGARVEEFLNLRFEDIETPTKNFPYYKVDIKEEYSKTLGRQVGLYWEDCTEAVTNYLASIDKKEPKDRVLEINYDALRMFLTRIGKRVLNKRIHAHMFRKSAATFYASKLNRQQLCKKFGWRFSSDVVDVYINRSGIDEVQIKDVMLNDDVSKLRQEIVELKTVQDQILNSYGNISEYINKDREETGITKKQKEIVLKEIERNGFDLGKSVVKLVTKSE